jgi:hypothetical protein
VVGLTDNELIVKLSGADVGAEQEAVVPPLPPAQLHDHGPEPVTDEAVPVLQRLVDGALPTVTPLADPQLPLTSSWAEHDAVEPPLVPVQFHDHGPEPVTVEAVPVLHKPVVGVLVRSAPFDAPQLPLTSSWAEHDAVEPPLVPVQFQFHGPEPDTDEAVPVLHKPVVGVPVRSAPFDAPHAPFVLRSAEQLAVEPPFDPVQLHDHGPEPVTDEAVPVLHKPVVGVLVRSAPFDAPHAPFVLRSAEQLAVVPPYDPAQLQFHGPEPVTDEAVPVLHKLVVGVLVRSAPFDAPHAPFVLRSAEQLAVVPPCDPVQLQPHGPEPVTNEAVPVLHKPVVGVLVRSAPFDAPHCPLTAITLPTTKVVVALP